MRKNKATAVHGTVQTDTGKLLASFDRSTQLPSMFGWACARVVVENGVPIDVGMLCLLKPAPDFM